MKSSAKITSFAHRRRAGSVLRALVACATVALACAAVAATKKIGNYTWTYVKVKGGVQIGDGVNVAVSPTPVGALKIPSKIGSLAVKSIGTYAFKDCVEMTSVTVPSGVSDIGMSTFEGCVNLKSASVPSTVKSYGVSVFAGCQSLTKAPLPKNLKVIPEAAFKECVSLKTVTIPSSVTEIAMEAFRWCDSLQAVKVPASVKEIGDHAFANCEQLQSVMIYSKVVGYRMFKDCPALKLVIMRSGVTSIGGEAFAGCSKLEGVALPHSLENIGTEAFDGALVTGRREVRYEVEGDDARCMALLNNSGYSDFLNLSYKLHCRLTVKPNNTKYGAAGIDDDGDFETEMWGYADDDEMVLLAKPKKGYYFAGWYFDKACKQPLKGDILSDPDDDYRMKRLFVVMPRKNTTVYAKFITKAQDKKALKFTSTAKKLATTATVCYPDACILRTVPAVSATLPKYSAKGLPSGLRIDEDTGEISGSATKPGTFTATVTAKSAAGNKVTQKVKFTVYAYDTAVGTFNGYARFKATDPAASLTFTVRAKGEVSGKVIFKDKSYSFTSQLSYSTPNWSQFSPSIKIGKTTYKPGKVMIYEFPNLETTVNAQVEGGTMEFCAYKKPDLIVDDGPLAGLVGEAVELTDEASGANLKVLFQKNDVALVSGTIGGKTVGCSSQLCLKGSYNNGTSDCYDVAVPVVLYKNKFYRTLYFTFVKHANGDVEPAVKEIRDISETNY